MKSTKISILLPLCLVPSLYAQSLPDVSLLMKTRFEGLSSLHAEMTIEKKLEPAYLEVEPGKNPSEPTVLAFSYWEKGRSFNYVLNKIKDKGNQLFIARQARAGDYDQYLTHLDGGTLELTRKPTRSYWLNSENATFLPFGFLAREDPSQISDLWASMPSLGDVSDPTLWSDLAKNSSLSFTSDPLNNDFVKMHFKVKGGGEGPYRSSEYWYDVTLSKQIGFFPISYKKLNHSGRVVLEVVCSDIAHAKALNGETTFTYPKEVIYRNYNDKGVLLVTVTSRIKLVEVNSISEDQEDELFNIDPSSANVIEDRDNGTFIKVPR